MLRLLLRCLFWVPLLSLWGCLYLDNVPEIAASDLDTEMDLSGHYTGFGISDEGKTYTRQAEWTVSRREPGIFSIQVTDEASTKSGSIHLLKAPPRNPGETGDTLALLDLDNDELGPVVMTVRTTSDGSSDQIVGFYWFVVMGDTFPLTAQDAVAQRFDMSAEDIHENSSEYGTLVRGGTTSGQLLAAYADRRFQAGPGQYLAQVLLPVGVEERGQNIAQADFPFAIPPDSPRVALVIGNEAYAGLPPLEKAVADAAAMSSVLTEKGYQVIYRENATRDEMDTAIAEFLSLIGPGDTAAFYYSGHGWSDGEQNFLLGVDAPFEATSEQQERISIAVQNGVNGIVDAVQKKGAGLKIIILDACRDNPFQTHTRGAGPERGLVNRAPPQGTFVIYSAGAGQKALDRLNNEDPDPNSVFTRVMLPLLREDVPLLTVVKQAQVQVYDLAQSIGYLQEPAYYDQVRGSPCLSGVCGGE